MTDEELAKTVLRQLAAFVRAFDDWVAGVREFGTEDNTVIHTRWTAVQAAREALDEPPE